MRLLLPVAILAFLAGCMGPSAPASTTTAAEGLPAMRGPSLDDPPGPFPPEEWVIREGTGGVLAVAAWTPVPCDEARQAQQPLRRVPFDANATLAAVGEALGFAPAATAGNGRWDGGAWEWDLQPNGTAWAAPGAAAWRFPWQGGPRATRDLLQRVVGALDLPAAVRVEGNLSGDSAAAWQQVADWDVFAAARLQVSNGQAELSAAPAWDVPGDAEVAPLDYDGLAGFLDCRFGGSEARSMGPLEAWRLSVEGDRLAWSLQRTWGTPDGQDWVQAVRVDAATGAVLEAAQERVT